MTLSNDKVRFPVNRAEISDEAKAIIDEAVMPLKTENRGVYFEIQGYTDATGEEPYNFRLGEDRAMAVRDYIAKTHGIALSRINVISYGESNPVADNKTRDGRAQNRRVVIRIHRSNGGTLSSDGPGAAPRPGTPFPARNKRRPVAGRP